MATVENKTITQTIRTGVVILTMTYEEAQVIRRIAGLVSGDPNNTNRRYSSAVYYALSKAGVAHDDMGITGGLTAR